MQLRSALTITLALAACGPNGDTTDTTDGTDTTDDTDTLDTTNTPPGPSPTDAECVEENGACILEGTYTESMRLTSDKAWLLRGKVQIGDDGSATTLTIQAGTTVYGEAASNAFLVIARGAKIMAEGTASSPIVFTSDQPEGTRARGDWGGVAINGYGLINGCAAGVDPCEAEGEGGTGTYGGNDNADNSGVMRYVRIQFGGTEISIDNEINGLGLQGVGSGTVLDHIQIHRNTDDGIEFWGGAVNASHILVTDAGDDGIDWDFGWTGKLQYAIVDQADDAGNNGTECDNNEANHLATPVSSPWISNVTFLGSEAIAEDNFGMLFRRGAAPNYSNIAVTGFTKACLSIRDTATIDNFSSGAASLERVMMDCATAFEDADEEPIFNAGSGNELVNDLGLVGWLPDGASPLLGAGQAPSDPWFEATTFVGAIGTDDWTTGWTNTDAD